MGGPLVRAVSHEEGSDRPEYYTITSVRACADTSPKKQIVGPSSIRRQGIRRPEFTSALLYCNRVFGAAAFSCVRQLERQQDTVNPPDKLKFNTLILVR